MDYNYLMREYADSSLEMWDNVSTLIDTLNYYNEDTEMQVETWLNFQEKFGHNLDWAWVKETVRQKTNFDPYY